MHIFLGGREMGCFRLVGLSLHKIEGSLGGERKLGVDMN